VISLKKTSLSILAIFVIFIVWLIFGAIVNNDLLLPKPLSVFKAFLTIFSDGSSLTAIGYTLIRLLAGLAIAFVFGFGLGLISGLNKNISYFLTPFITILRTVPVISITVLLLIILGFNLTPYVITFLMLFPLIYQATYGSIKALDQELIDVYRLEDNSLYSAIRHCYIPLIAQEIKTSLLQSMGLGIKVLVMAEYLSQTKKSIGNYLYLAKTNIEYDKVFAWTLVLVLLALFFEAIINRYQSMKRKASVLSSSEKSN
jgi:NitT/TauT family transport system permease protein